ncbi:MAG: hypothetical protein QG635_749, partial [Bacteroidota bacterium]|nr:hypothetical protein [Bacteroidota bacterium]
QPGRNWVSTNGGEYWNRFGFNGKEKDDELKGKGNSCDYGARHYDPRLARFMSLDPDKDKYPSISQYLYADNNPVVYLDKGGKGPDPKVWESSLYFTNRAQAKELEKSKIFVATHGGIKAGIIGIAIPVVIEFGIPYSIKMGTGAAAWLWRLDPDGSKTAGTIAGILDPNPSADYPGFGDDIARGAKSVWNMSDRFARGIIIEKMLGGNLPERFPVIDKFLNGVATSIKSLDLRADTYKDASKLKSTLKGYVDKLAKFKEGTFRGKEILENDIKSKTLQIAIPSVKLTDEQNKAIKEAVDYGIENNINVDVKQIEADVKEK